MNVRKKIRDLLKEESPIVLSMNKDTHKSELQQMPYKKWNALDRSKKDKIRTLVGKRNDRVLDKIDDEEELSSVLSQIEKHVGEKNEEESQSALPISDESAKPISDEKEQKNEKVEIEKEQNDEKVEIENENYEKNKDEENNEQENEKVEIENEENEKGQNDEKVEIENEENEKVEIDDESAKPISDEKGQNDEKVEIENEDEDVDEDKVCDDGTGDDDDETPVPQTDSNQSDLDLTPNFVNVFFTYVNSLMDKPIEAVKVDPKPPESPTVQKSVSVEATPDYSDPSVFQDNAQDSLPQGWEMHVSESSDPGKTYYFNPQTGETVWERPTTSEEKALPEGWTKHVSEKSDPGAVYYMNEKTGETRWSHPSENEEKRDSVIGEVEKSEESGKSEESEKLLPPGWTAHVSETSEPGKTYYYHEETGETVWNKPTVETEPGSEPGSEPDRKSDENTERAEKPVVEGQCYKCGNTQNLHLKTYKLENDRAIPVHFCCFKCFESIEF